MSPERRDAILAAIRLSPDGTVTAKTLAPILRWTPLAASRDLGKLFTAGYVTRQKIERSDGREFIYRESPAPPPPKLTWLPEVRIAGSMIRETA